jgi:two-component system nitrate/nitrite response regulator NarL
VNILLHEPSLLLADSLAHELRSVGHVVRVAVRQEDLVGLVAQEPPDIVILADLLGHSPSPEPLADTAAVLGIPVLVVASPNDAAGGRRSPSVAGAVPSVVTLGSLIGALDGVVKKRPLRSVALDGSPRGPATETLTPREQQVLSLLAKGASTRLIAERLGVSQSTARTYVQRVLQRLGAHSRIEALSRVSTPHHESAGQRLL